MSPVFSAVLAVIGVVLGAGGIGTVIVSHHLRKGDPLTRKEVQSAYVADSLEAMGVSRDAAIQDATLARDEVARIRERVGKLEEDRDTDRRRISRLETLLGAGLRYIETLLRFILAGGQGRVPAPEDELTPHIDPKLHAWASSPPGDGQDTDHTL